MREPSVDVLLGMPYDPDPRVRRITQALADAGYNVRVLAWDRDGTRPARELDGDVLVERVHVASRRSRGWTQVFFLFPLLAAYTRRMRKRRPTIVHAVDLPMLLIAAVAVLFVQPRPRLVFEAFEIYEVMVSHRMPPMVLWAIKTLERWLPRLAEVVITPGEGRRKYFAARGIESVSVPNWIDPPTRNTERSVARKSLGLDDGQFCIAYAGSLNHARDLESLIRHAERTPDDVVLIAGDGELRAVLEGRAALTSNVRMLGWVADPSRLLAAADAVYYALRPEHAYAAHVAPNNLYIAISHGVPLIYRPQGELGVLGARHLLGASFGDDASLDRAIDELRGPERNEEVRRALREIRGDYSWSNAAQRLLSAYPKSGSARSRESPNGP